LVQDGRLVTPDRASSALDGITRDTVVRLAGTLGIPAEFRRVSPGELYTSEELFLTGTAAEVVPITSVGGRAVGSGPGPVTRSIMGAYADMVAGRGDAPDGWLTPVY
jgi:branched-chain amino acid aminotransferase